jgi:hypothetical protein
MVVIVNVAVVAPEATVTVDGKVALLLLDDRVTAVPPGPAGPLRVIVAVEELPPTTSVGDSETAVRLAALTVRDAVKELAPWVAVSVAEVELDTGVVVIENVPEVAPAATVAVEGTEAVALLDERLITNPPVGAGPLSVRVPVELDPPTTVVGEIENAFNAGGLTTRVALTEIPPSDAEIVADSAVDTAMVLIGKVAVFWPDITVTFAGTVTPVVSDDKLTTTPPVGAFALSVTVPVDGAPPKTEFGEMVSVDGVGMFSIRSTNAEKIIAPQPVTVSQPGPALDCCPLGRLPLVPEMTSKNRVGSPLKEYRRS